jgi:hypothetical protein
MARFGVQGKGSSRRRTALVAVAISFFASAGMAGESPVVIGEVSGTTASGEYKTPLFRAVSETLGQTKLGRPRERFVLSVSLVTLDAKKDGKSVSAIAVVSLVLRREKEQTLHAMLRGSATAQESDSTLDSARETALRAAVESAMRRLPEAVK